MRESNIRFHLNFVKGYMNAFLNRFLPVRTIFERIYRYRKKQNAETVSGPGSTRHETEFVIKIVASVIRRYEIRRMLDIPCGDLNWMRHVDLGDVFYHGADIVDQLVEINRRMYPGKNRSFNTMDLLKDNLPEVDLILCRDCLVHFSFKHLHLAIANIKRSGATYLLTTTFPGSKNQDVNTGDWFMLNLQASPFWLPEPLELFNEGYHDSASGANGKSLGLWKITDLSKT